MTPSSRKSHSLPLNYAGSEMSLNNFSLGSVRRPTNQHLKRFILPVSSCEQNFGAQVWDRTRQQAAGSLATYHSAIRALRRHSISLLLIFPSSDFLNRHSNQISFLCIFQALYRGESFSRFDLFSWSLL